MHSGKAPCHNDQTIKVIWIGLSCREAAEQIQLADLACFCKKFRERLQGPHEKLSARGAFAILLVNRRKGQGCESRLFHFTQVQGVL